MIILRSGTQVYLYDIHEEFYTSIVCHHDIEFDDDDVCILKQKLLNATVRRLLSSPRHNHLYRFKFKNPISYNTVPISFYTWK